MDKVTRNKYNWNGITIGMYNDIAEVLNGTEDDYTKLTTVMSIIEDTDIENIWNLKMNEWNERKECLNFLNDFKVGYCKWKKIKFGNREYIISNDLNDLTVAQWMEYYSTKFNNDIANLLVIFLVPKGHKFNDGYNLEDEKQFITDNCNFLVGESILNFIFAKYGKSLASSLLYLAKQVKKEKNQEKKEALSEKLSNMVIATQNLIHTISIRQ